MNRAIFLDRDGVINAVVLRDSRPYPPPLLEEFQFLPGVVDATGALGEAGFLIIVVTNQPDVRTGVQRREVVELMHERLRNELPIQDIKVCYHIDQDDCLCRKPKPGMLLDAAEEWDLDLGGSFMVGDRWRDIEAGRSAGCQTIFVDYGYAERRPENPNMVVGSLLEASHLVLENNTHYC